MEPIDYKAIAAQLAHPTGDEGIRVAQNMNLSNRLMTTTAIDTLRVSRGMKILEIGPGNGKFAEYVVNAAAEVEYTGVDISQTMIDEAQRINSPLVADGYHAAFTLTDGLTLDFKDNTFDAIFTVNTIYFWADPLGFAKEILRVLQPNGKCCIALATRAFMEKLPFTDERFKLYEAEEVSTLLFEAGFRKVKVDEKQHETTSANKMVLLRDELFVIAEK